MDTEISAVITMIKLKIEKLMDQGMAADTAFAAIMDRTEIEYPKVFALLITISEKFSATRWGSIPQQALSTQPTTMNHPTNSHSQLVPSLTCGEVSEIVELLVETRHHLGNQTTALQEWLADNNRKIPAHQFGNLLLQAQTAWEDIRREAAKA